MRQNYTSGSMVMITMVSDHQRAREKVTQTTRVAYSGLSSGCGLSRAGELSASVPQRREERVLDREEKISSDAGMTFDASITLLEIFAGRGIKIR
jgi:hypothetical protein